MTEIQRDKAYQIALAMNRRTMPPDPSKDVQHPEFLESVQRVVHELKISHANTKLLEILLLSSINGKFDAELETLTNLLEIELRNRQGQSGPMQGENSAPH